MKRIAFCLALLVCGGCMMDDGFVYDDGVWYDVADAECNVCAPGPAVPAATTTPRVVPLGPGVLPAGGIPAPPRMTPQTREPELIR